MSKTYSVQPNYAIYYRSASLHNPTSTPTSTPYPATPFHTCRLPRPSNTKPHSTPPLICTILGASLHNPASTPTSTPYPGRAFSRLPGCRDPATPNPIQTLPHLHHPGCLTTQPRINTHLNTVPRPRLFTLAGLPRPSNTEPHSNPPPFAPSWVPHYTTPRTPAAPPLFPPLQATASRPPPTPPHTAPPLCGSSSQRQGAPQ